MVVYERNAVKQLEVAQLRQQAEAGRALAQLYQNLAQAVALLAKEKDDKELIGLLAGEGLLPAAPTAASVDLSPRVKNLRKSTP